MSWKIYTSCFFFFNSFFILSLVQADTPKEPIQLRIADDSFSTHIINGTCGTAYGGSYNTIAHNLLCSTGSNSNVNLQSGMYYWSCLGSGGGSSQSCSASHRASEGARCGNGIKEGSEICDDGNTISADFCSNSCTVPHIIYLDNLSQRASISSGWNRGTYYQSYFGYDYHASTTPGDVFTFNFDLQGTYSVYLKIPYAKNNLVRNLPIEIQGIETIPLSLNQADNVRQWVHLGNHVFNGSSHITFTNNQTSTSWPYTVLVDALKFERLSNSTVSICGNGIQENLEECDDGNNQNGDTCSSSCQTTSPPPASCGNNSIEFGEECDDGNLIDFDGCSSSCKYDTPAPVCGNQLIEAGESCDDGNAVNGDGCSSNCQLGSGVNTCNSIDINADDVTYKWRFNSGGAHAFCGQFANGDYWIAPGAGQRDVTITSATIDGDGLLFVDENPRTDSIGFLSHDYGNLDTSQRIIPQLPVTYNYNTSLVGAIQRTVGGCGTKAILNGCVDSYNVLTVLDRVPPNWGSNILRPSIDETKKELLSLDDFDFSRFPSKSYFTISSNKTAAIETIRKTWSHSIEILSMRSPNGNTYSEGGRAFRAHKFVDDYAAGVAAKWHSHLASLMSDQVSQSERQPALAAMLTYGKDIYYAVHDEHHKLNGGWNSGAGQWLGRFPAAVFFAALARDSKYGDALKKTAEITLGHGGPHELEQVNTGPNGGVWGDGGDLPNTTVTRYWTELYASGCYVDSNKTCNTNVGNKAVADPYRYIDGPANKPGASYMAVSMGQKRAFVGMMSLIPEMCEITNYQPLIQYVDRFESRGLQVSNDKCAPPDPRESSDCSPWEGGKNCLYYGLNNSGTATWGPDPDNPYDCIRNAPGQNGRFPHLNGVKSGYNYTSGQFELNWTQIRSEATGRCKTP